MRPGPLQSGPVLPRLSRQPHSTLQATPVPWDQWAAATAVRASGSPDLSLLDQEHHLKQRQGSLVQAELPAQHLVGRTCRSRHMKSHTSDGTAQDYEQLSDKRREQGATGAAQSVAGSVTLPAGPPRLLVKRGTVVISPSSWGTVPVSPNSHGAEWSSAPAL